MRSRKLALLLMALAVIPSLGCRSWYQIRDTFYFCEPIDEAILTYNCNRAAKAAWLTRESRFCDRECLDHFAAGFRAGYADVAMGGTGCPPPLPPRRYWGWRYQNAEGQKCVASWFDGYPAGARAAEEDGVANWTRMQTSYLIDAQYAARMPGARRGGPAPSGIPFPGEEIEALPALTPSSAQPGSAPSPADTEIHAPGYLSEEPIEAAPVPSGDYGVLRNPTESETTIAPVEPEVELESTQSVLRKFDMPAVEVLSGVSVPKKQLASLEPAPEVNISETTPIESSEPAIARALPPIVSPKSSSTSSGVIAETTGYSLSGDEAQTESTHEAASVKRSLPPIVPSKAPKSAPPIIRSLKERGRVTKLEKPSPTKPVSFEEDVEEEKPVLRRLETSK